MKWFRLKKKKRDELKILNEREIQKKLYGFMQSSIGPKIAQSTRQKSQSMSAPIIPNEKTEENGVKDLFEDSGPYADVEEVQSDSPISGVEEQKRDDEIKISRWVDSEQETISRVSPVVLNQLKIKKKKKIIFWKPIGQFVVASIKRVTHLIRSAIFFIVNFLVSIIPKKSWQYRQLAYWISALGFLAVLFGGIHFLNIQREKAMSGGQEHEVFENVEIQKIVSLEKKDASGESSAVNLLAEKKAETAQEVVRSDEGKKVLNLGSQKDLPYVIQIATYANEKDAVRASENLRDQGLPVFVYPLSRSGTRVYYCIFLGRFPDYKRAEGELSKFMKLESAKPFEDAFIRKLTS